MDVPRQRLLMRRWIPYFFLAAAFLAGAFAVFLAVHAHFLQAIRDLLKKNQNGHHPLTTGP